MLAELGFEDLVVWSISHTLIFREAPRPLNWVFPRVNPDISGTGPGVPSLWATMSGGNMVGMVMTAVWDRYRRASDDRVLAGVAAGLGRAVGIDAAYVRAGFIVLTACLGIGVFVYLILWAVRKSEVDDYLPTVTLRAPQQAGLAVGFLGFLLLLREVGVWPGDAVLWSITLVAFGVAVMWHRTDGRIGRIAYPGDSEQRPSVAQILAGAVLTVAGVALALSQVGALAQVGSLVFGVAITVVGVSLVFGPWIVRLIGDLGDERRDRIRATERAEVAAHLHDSVLQTLALIQRSDDPRRTVTLARAQERELRAWLYGRQSTTDGTPLSIAMEALAGRIESQHDVIVELVTVGDAQLNGHLDALVAATGEALTNAAKHAGVSEISLYVEVEGDSIDVYVSDQGKGFDHATVPEDRRGVTESIVGRMERHGGTATITSGPGDGTEVHLTIGVKP